MSAKGIGVTVAMNGWIEVSEPDTSLVLRIGGELDMGSRAVIEPAVLAAVESSPHVVLDLADLTFCDSNGIAMFLVAQEHAVAAGSTIAFRNVTGAVRRMFEITCLDVIFGVATEVADSSRMITREVRRSPFRRAGLPL